MTLIGTKGKGDEWSTSNKGVADKELYKFAQRKLAGQKIWTMFENHFKTSSTNMEDTLN